LLLALPVRAQDPIPPPDVPPLPAPAAVSAPQAREIDQMVYKGVVGNILDKVPMDTQERLDLQRANAVVGNALGARSVAILLGITASPLFLIGGLMWGLIAASKIKSADTPQAAQREPAQAAREEPAQAAQQPVQAEEQPPLEVARRIERPGECGEDWLASTATTADLPAIEAVGVAADGVPEPEGEAVGVTTADRVPAGTD